MIGTGKPKISARNANQAVFRTAIPSSGSARTRWKFWRPTKTGSATRLVFWTLITNARMIGNHANRPKITSIGSRNASVVRPARVTRNRAARERAPTLGAGATSLIEPMSPDHWLIGPTLVRRRIGGEPRRRRGSR